MNPSSEPPLVSIVTPSFNQAQFLEQTILSVVGQDYPYFEYLLVDGASSDGSLEIIQRYAGRLAWWVSEPDHGQAEAINKGLVRAKGKYLAWLNSDDIYLPGAISKAVTSFSRHPEAGLVYGDVLAIDEDGKPINLLRYGQWSLVDLMSFRVIGQPSVFIRRSILEKAGYLDPSYHFLLDHQLWLRMAQLAEICYIPDRLSAARFHSESKNVARAAEFGSEVLRIQQWMDNQPALASILHKDRKRIQAGAHSLRAFYLLDGGDAAASLREYLRCLSLHPPILARDWKHFLAAFFNLLGFNKLGIMYKRLRRSNIKGS
jgi:glycosyltransferase involved in cell wall biosynthesis